MEIKHSFVIHILLLIVGGVTECLALKFSTVAEGDTLVLKCPVKSENVHMEWRNQKGHVMFFNNIKGLKDPRISVFNLNKSEYTLHVSNVTLEDEGFYRCLVYEDEVSIKRFKVKVVGIPKIEMAEHEGKAVIKCTAAANGLPPELTWQVGGVEIDAVPNTWREGRSNKSMAVSVLTIKTHIRQATVKCLAKHKDLQVMNFIIIENHTITTSITTIYSSSRDELKTEAPTTATPAFSTTAHVDLSSVSESTEVLTTEETTSNSGEVEEYSAATDISLTTYDINSSTSNSSEEYLTKNVTDSGDDIKDPGRQLNQKQSSPLLILLVACLITCLLIVVIFFVMRLRRAHLAFKKENEESDQSVESSKSKSSHEEKQAQKRRRQGFWNSNFTKVEEPPQNTENSAANIDVISETQDNSAAASNKLDGACVKETEL